jgi:hypothetical protein
MNDATAMFNFIRRKAGAFHFQDYNKTAYDCKFYEIEGDGVVPSRLFYSEHFAMMDIPQQSMTRIERESRFLKKDNYVIFKHPGYWQIGEIRFPGWQARYKCSVHLDDGTQYLFQKHTEHTRVFKPKTWNDYRYSLSGGEFPVFYSGRYVRKKMANKKQRIFEGEIRMPCEHPMLPVLVGLYLIEEHFRMEMES